MLHRIKNTAARLWKDEGGASLLEYSVLVGLIITGVVVTIGTVATWTGERWTTLNTKLGDSKTGAATP